MRPKRTLYEQFIAKAIGRRARALKLREAGKSYADIAADLGISKQRAWELVQQAKVEAGASA